MHGKTVENVMHSLPVCMRESTKKLKHSGGARASTVHSSFKDDVGACRLSTSPKLFFSDPTLNTFFGPAVFGRNLQCQLVRGVNTREECHWSTRMAALQAEQRRETQGIFDSVNFFVEKRAPYT
jgi:hypothetical protein